MITWNTWTLLDKECSQIIGLVEAWSRGSQKIDRRRYTKMVIRFADKAGLIAKRDDGRYYTSSDLVDHRYFFPDTDLPPQILWRMVEPIVGQHSGYSIIKNPDWCNLNIYPEGSRSHSERDVKAIEVILMVLERAGFIDFQTAGTTWRIEACHAS